MVVNRLKHRLGVAGLVLSSLLLGLATVGCNHDKKSTKPVLTSNYPTLPMRQVPAFMENTIYQRTETRETSPLTISGYGLVVNLRGTGNSQAPTPVRDFMIREMLKHSIKQPEKVLADPRVAIVEVYAEVPPGAKRDDIIDARIAALSGSYTTSLSGGQLYETSLYINGANPAAPDVGVFLWGLAGGDLLVNPNYALIDPANDPDAQRSLRNAAIPNGVRVKVDRAIMLQVRNPSYAMARAIQERINERFQDPDIAHAQDDGVVRFMVPAAYGKDWQHFSQLINHLYLYSGPAFNAHQAQVLAEEALKPDAPLLDISFCFEGLGREALPAMAPLLRNPSPDIAFAAARAGAYMADTASQAALIQMAQTPDHPFQLNAIQTLASLPYTPMVAGVMRNLLSSEQMSIRLAAYNVLSKNKDPIFLTKVIAERFVLDMAPAAQRPMVYMSRSGIPRIALIGQGSRLQTPMVFSAMDNRLTISSTPDNKKVTLYYRSTLPTAPITIQCEPDMVSVLLRLGGSGPMGDLPSLGLGYSDIIAVMAKLASEGRIVSASEKDFRKLEPIPVVMENASSVNIVTDLSPVQAPVGVQNADALPPLLPDSTQSAQPDVGSGTARPQ